MNILGKEQKKMLEKGISQEEYERRKQAFLKLYYEIREKDEESIFNNLTLKQRFQLHKIILGIYKLKNKMGGFSCELISDEREQTERPIIFAVTHVGKYDIEVISEAIKDHYYLLSGDYEHLQGLIDGKFLYLNGVFYFNEIDKEDRKKVTKKMIEHLNDKGNLMYFIEGTWNLTPNLPMLPCYWGIVDIAKKSNAIIIPVAAEQYGKKFKVKIGKNFDMNNYGEGTTNKSKAIEDLRDILATLKWEIWETEEPLKREDIVGDEWEQYVENRFQEWPGFDMDYVNNLIFKPKGVTEPEEAFSHLKKLIPNKANAFLYSKRVTGYKSK